MPASTLDPGGRIGYALSMKCSLILLFLTLLLGSPTFSQTSAPPNILWIFVDDMSDWMGCYGHDLAETPHIDRLSSEGIQFNRAYMPAPVCSSTRSALITGTMQTTFGLHHHRTMIKKPLPAGIRTVPELFRDAGYVTFNEKKDDYNFRRNRALMYSPEFKGPKFNGHLQGTDLSWLAQLKGKRFFGQIQLLGGKEGGESGVRYPAESRVDAKAVTVPPYYPDTPELRNAIARHYEQVAMTDVQVGAIMEALETYGMADNTITFFFTDHGAPLPRVKQFLYEDGVKVPLIIHGLDRDAMQREDLVSGIDIPVTSLGLAGIAIPDFMEGRDVLAEGHVPRDHVISARDRCGIAVDRIRAVGTKKYRYIRNYQTDRALYQSQYRDRYATFQNMKGLFEAGKLTPLQASYWQADQRPSEEFYDLEADPHQVRNLAADVAHAAELARHRKLLAEWVLSTGDRGHLPEDPESLKLVYKVAKGKAPAPEFDFIRKK